MNQITNYFRELDRIAGNTWLIVVCFLSVLLLSSQSAASLPTYVLAIAMLLQVREWRDVFHCTFIWPIAALLIYLPASVLWSPDPTLSEFVSQTGRGLLTFMFVVAVAECQLRGKIQASLGYSLGLTGGLVALLCIVLFYLEPPKMGRLNGLGQLDTEVVAALVFGATSVLVLHLIANSEKLWERACGVLTLLPLLCAVWLSDSRNAIVSVSLGLSVILLANFVTSRRRFLASSGALVLLVLVGAAALWSNPEFREWLLPRGDSFRLTIWSQIIERLEQRPWFGFGVLADDDTMYNGFVFQHPHNLYLAVAYQGGVVGLILFVWLIVRALREALRAYTLPDAKLVLGLFAVALPSYLLDGHELLDKISDTWFLFWLPVALALGLRWHVSSLR